MRLGGYTRIASSPTERLKTYGKIVLQGKEQTTSVSAAISYFRKEYFMNTFQKFNQISAAIGLHTVSSIEFYRTIFAEGELQKTGIQEKGLYNAMIQVGKKFIYLHDELDNLPEGVDIKGATMNCLTYAGESGADELAMELHAFVVRVYFPDKFDGWDMMSFLNRHMRKRKYVSTTKIAPTFITTSAENQAILFYYVLDTPIPIYKKYIKKLTSIQAYLSHEIHNGLREAGLHTPDNGIVPEQTGIYTRYPVVGTFVDGYQVEAYKTGDLYSLKEINALIPKSKRLNYKPSTATLEEAKEKWPVWAQKVLVEGRDMSGKKYKEPNEALLKWYIDTVKENAESVKPGIFEGLAAYAVKGNILFSRLWSAMEELEKTFSGIFSKADMDWHIVKAWELYEDAPKKLKYWSITHIEKITGLSIHRNKRNGKTQQEHLANLHKAQSKKDVVKRWRKKHPEGTKAECARELGISWVTANRWWEPSKKEPKPTAKPKIPAWRKCKVPGCTGTLIDTGTQEWFGTKFGMHYKRIIRTCDKCQTKYEGKPRIVD